MNVVEEKVDKSGNMVKIVVDENCESPREWDNLGTFYTWDRRYCSPDKNPYVDVDSFMEEHEEAIKEGDIFILPVYKYEHSGVAYQTTPFSCPWDSGQVGYIFVTKEKILKEYGE